jgi:hypothetical protein
MGRQDKSLAGSLTMRSRRRLTSCAKDGKRGGFLIVNLSDASEMPRFAEPWFLNFEATVEFLPTMTPQDLQRAGLDQLAKKWQ